MATGKPHWIVPTLMASGLLLGILLAIGHHLFYASLDKQVILNNDQQQWNTRIGTGLAFLVKTFLTASAGLAYTQLLWHTLKSQPVTLQGVDALFGVVNNAWDFLNWELWRRGPVLAIIAVVLWTLPLVAVVTPATLAIRPALQPNVTIIHRPIPVIEYADVQKFAPWSVGVNPYAGPSSRISRFLSTVASQGAILNISPPFPNSSYIAEFYGPSVSCGPTGNATFDTEIGKVINSVRQCGGNGCGGEFTAYIGFTPQTYSVVGPGKMVDYALNGLNLTLYDDQISTLKTYDGTPLTDHARLFVSLPVEGENNTQTIECGLYNSSYTVEFAFNNGQQDVTVKNMTRFNGITSGIAQSACGSNTGGGNCSVQAVAGFSIMDALGAVLLGRVDLSHMGNMEQLRTHITSTVLMDTQEMQKALNPVKNNMVPSDTKPAPLSIANITMAEALEQIVINTTLSLFSDSYFLQNDTTASMGEITVRTPQNAYQYNQRNLILAYTIGVVVATGIVIVGFVCIWGSSHSFGASFSVILRTTRNPELDALIPSSQTNGAEPISKELAESKIMLQRRVNEVEGGERTAFRVVGADGQGQERKYQSVNNWI